MLKKLPGLPDETNRALRTSKNAIVPILKEEWNTIAKLAAELEADPMMLLGHLIREGMNQVIGDQNQMTMTGYFVDCRQWMFEELIKKDGKCGIFFNDALGGLPYVSSTPVKLRDKGLKGYEKADDPDNEKSHTEGLEHVSEREISAFFKGLLAA